MSDLKPVVAVLFLIVISVCVAVATYIIVIGQVSASSIRIEKIDREAIYIRNNGANTVYVSSISILDSDGNIIYQKELGLKLEPKTLLIITYPPTEKYTIKIATKQGEIKANYGHSN